MAEIWSPGNDAAQLFLTCKRRSRPLPPYKERYTGLHTYDLLSHSCNHFSNEVH